MISNRCHYALRALLELALAEGSGPMPIAAIAKQQKIPTRFLEAILRQLKQARLADSVRGKDGGYALAKPASTITVGDVVRLFEGPLVTGQAPVAPAPPSPSASAPVDVFQEVWQKAEAALAGVYDGTTFSALAERERMGRAGGIANYAI